MAATDTIPEPQEAAMSSTQTLVAVDWEGEALDVGPVLSFVEQEGAYVAYSVEVDEAGRITHRLTFDRKKVRGTHVHGVGFRAGFIVSLS